MESQLARCRCGRSGRGLVGAGDGAGRPEALIAESLAGDPIGLVVLRVDRPEARSVELSLLVDAGRWGQGFGTT